MLIPAEANVAIPVWQPTAAFKIPIANVAPDASPKRNPRSSTGSLRINSRSLECPGSTERWATRQWSTVVGSMANKTEAETVHANPSNKTQTQRGSLQKKKKKKNVIIIKKKTNTTTG